MDVDGSRHDQELARRAPGGPGTTHDPADPGPLGDGWPDAPGDDPSGVAALAEATADLHRRRDLDEVRHAVLALAVEVCEGDAAALVTRDNPYEPWRATASTGAAAPDWAPAALLADHATDPGSPPQAVGEDLVALLRSDTPGAGAAVVVHRAGRAFTPTERRSLGWVAAHASAAIENASCHAAVDEQLAQYRRALAERARITRALQQSLLPPELPTIDGVDLAAVYRPSAGEIGGDLLDVFPLRDGAWGLAVADVCGKGPEAAATTALARHTLRAAAATHRRPGRVLGMLNDALVARTDDPGRFLTGVFARLEVDGEGATVTAAMGGHPPVLVLRADGNLEQHGPTGRLLGIFEDVVPDDLAIELAPGDCCVVYTDGATDVRRGIEVFGETRLAEVLAGCRGMGAAGIAESIERAVVDFQDDEPEDDLALVVVAMPPARPIGP